MHRLLLAALTCLLISPLSAQDYQDVAAMQGIDHSFLDNGTFGGGTSFMDFNGDGWDDITFASHYGDSIYFYRNFGGSFVRVHHTGIEATCQSKQVMWVDLENDGDQDFFVACHGQGNHLYENTGAMNFQEITVQAGLDTISEFTFGCSFGDIDNDGDLDMAIFNRGLADNRSILLYENNGDLTFDEITVSAEVDDIPVGPFCGTFLDYNTDGFLDLYIAQDKYFGNNLFENDGDNTFTDMSNATGLGDSLDAMCVAPGDYDNDDDIDIYVTNTSLEGNHLFTNNGNGTYTETAAGTPLVVNGFDWGANFFDVENDGDLDLYISGIYTIGTSTNSWLYRNHGDGMLSPAVPGMPNDNYQSYSNAIGDYNKDGFPDIAVNNYDETRSKLWKNLNSEMGFQNNWIKIRLRGTQSNINGYGTKLEVYSGGQKQLRYTYCGEAFIGQNAAHEIFGLGTSTTVDSVVITWLSGIVDVLYNPTINQETLVVESSISTGVTELTSPFSILQTDGSGIFYIKPIDNGSAYFNISIYMSDGKLLDQRRIDQVSAGELYPVDISRHPRGSYIVTISNQNGKWAEIIIR